MTRRPFEGKRRVQSRPLKERLLIVCEGRATEPNYLDGLKRFGSIPAHFAITVAKGRGGTRFDIAESAVSKKRELGNNFDRVLLLMDVEHAEHRESLERALPLLAKHGIEVFLSNPSFEVWLLAHFERTGKWFENGARVEDQLNQHWSREFESEYAKGDVRNFARLQSRLPAVTENAKSVREHQHTGVAMKDANSATEMYIPRREPAPRAGQGRRETRVEIAVGGVKGSPKSRFAPSKRSVGGVSGGTWFESRARDYPFGGANVYFRPDSRERTRTIGEQATGNAHRANICANRCQNTIPSVPQAPTVASVIAPRSIPAISCNGLTPAGGG